MVSPGRNVRMSWGAPGVGPQSPEDQTVFVPCLIVISSGTVPTSRAHVRCDTFATCMRMLNVPPCWSRLVVADVDSIDTVTLISESRQVTGDADGLPLG